MTELVEYAIQYGIAGIALFMMYSITYNHLTAIQTTLTNIEKLLQTALGLDPD